MAGPTSTPRPGRFAPETGWLVAGGLLLIAALRPWHFLGDRWEGLLPATLILVAPAPVLAAYARSGGLGASSLLAIVWWGLGGLFLTQIDPLFGIPAWLGMIAFAIVMFAPLGLALGALRERHGASAMLWLAPLVWCGWDMLRSWGPFGCPYASLAHAFWKTPVLQQISEISGYRVLNLPVILIAGGFARLLLRDRQAGRQLAAGFALLAAFAAYGTVRLAGFEDSGEPIPTALVQAAVPMRDKQRADVFELFDRHLALTRQAPPGTRLIVWPETAVPTQIMALGSMRESLFWAARQQQATLLVGGVDSVPPGDLSTEVKTNAAFVICPSGRLLDTYHKRHLVILGEYLPFRDQPLLRRLAAMTPQYWAGGSYRAVTTPFGRIGVPICFESAFPQDCRPMVRDGAEALVTITNDDQMTEFGARLLYQQTVFRSVETRRWVARCANSGISCFVAPTGRIIDSSEWRETRLLVESVRLRTGRTPYVRYGEWLPWLALLASIAALCAPRRKGRG